MQLHNSIVSSNGGYLLESFLLTTMRDHVAWQNGMTVHGHCIFFDRFDLPWKRTPESDNQHEPCLKIPSI